MRDHPWHRDTVFWRTRPITPRMLFASQMLALGLVVLLPFAAGLLLHVLPLSLGPLPTALAIVVPLTAAIVADRHPGGLRLAGHRDRGRDMLPVLRCFRRTAAVRRRLRSDSHAGARTPWLTPPG